MAHALIKILEKVRKEKRYSQATVSAQLGVPQSHLSKIESGKTDLRLSSFIEWAHALGLEPMLVPRTFVPAVSAIIRGKNLHTPKYQLEEDENEAD